jgi:DNA-directed RNA polymerase specialized sigma24 family protein
MTPFAVTPMSRARAPFPSREEGLTFHLRLLDADPLAPADVCRAYLVPLADWLDETFRIGDPHAAPTAAGDALMNYVQRPLAYDPHRIDLAAYLRMAARCDLANLLRKEGRHHEHRVPMLLVELGEESGNLSGREEEPAQQLEHEEEAAAREDFLRSAQEGWTTVERRVFELMLTGERSTPAFARVLGIESRPAEEQEREVKRVKDRILARLKREGRKHD